MDRSADANRKGAIETFIIDWPVLIFIGLLFGALAPETDPWSSRAFKAGTVASVVLTATAFISYVVAPDWMWMYFAVGKPIVWPLPFIAVGYLITFVLAFAAALGLRALGRGYVIAGAASALIGEAVMVAMTWDRYRLVGTKQQWLAGNTVHLFGTSPEGPVRVIAPLGPIFVVVLVAGVVLTIRGRRAASADR